jgi:hypothetical protein
LDAYIEASAGDTFRFAVCQKLYVEIAGQNYAIFFLVNTQQLCTPECQMAVYRRYDTPVGVVRFFYAKLA